MRTRHSSRLFAFGSNGAGQLGIGHTADTAVPQPCIFDDDSDQELRFKAEPKVNDHDTISKVAAGGNHTLVLFRSGVAYAAGSNKNGRCGLAGEMGQTSVFRRVRLVERGKGKGGEGVVTNFVDVAATWEASFFVVEGGGIYVCGSGAKGELGLGEGVTETQERGSSLDLSQVLGRAVEIATISCGMSHVVVGTTEDEVIGWGSCRKGQLGESTKLLKILWEPREMEISFPPQHIVTGRDFTLIINEHDNTLLGDRRYLLDFPAAFTCVGENDFVTAGWSSVYCLSRNRLRAHGRNDRGQLPAQQIPDLRSMAAGSEHCVGLSRDGDVIAWGWGEHGNCGLPTNANGNVAGHWNIISLDLENDEIVIDVAAGCATSFVVVDKKKETSVQ